MLSNNESNKRTRSITDFAHDNDDHDHELGNENPSFDVEENGNNHNEDLMVSHYENGYQFAEQAGAFAEHASQINTSSSVSGYSSSIFPSAQSQASVFQPQIIDNELLPIVTIETFESKHSPAWAKHFKPVSEVITRVGDDGVLREICVVARCLNSKSKPNYIVSCVYCGHKICLRNFSGGTNQKGHFDKCQKKPTECTWKDGMSVVIDPNANSQQ